MRPEGEIFRKLAALTEARAYSVAADSYLVGVRAALVWVLKLGTEDLPLEPPPLAFRRDAEINRQLDELSPKLDPGPVDPLKGNKP